MEKIQEKLQKFSGVVYVFVKIGYVASIVGLILCACALLWGIIFTDPSKSIQLGSVKIMGIIGESDMNLAETYGMTSYLMVYFAFLIVVLKMMLRLFSNMRDNYTPFTMENAEFFKRSAIWMIVASIVPATVGQIVGTTCGKLMSLSFSGEYSDGFSLVTVLLFFAMSMVFQYGCALQEEADTTL